MEPIPILYVIPRMSIGGAQTHLLEVLRLLDRRRFAPLLCCLATDRGDPPHLLRRVHELGVPVIDGGLRDVPNSLARPHTWRQMVRVAGIARRHGVGLVHSYLFHGNWFGTLTARLARVPAAIASKRNVDVYARARDRWACRLVNRLAQRIAVVSRAVGDHVQRAEGCPREKVVVIPNGIDASRFEGPPSDDPIVRRTIGTGPATAVIGTITRLVWYKGLEDLLQAAAAVTRDHPRARFVIVGDGPLRRPLEEKARTFGLDGSVRFAGAVPGAAALLPHFDIFVLASLWEGMSNSLLEAMAAARPVVATTAGGNPEVVVDGETGFLVPPKDPEALAAAIRRLLDAPELAQRLGRAGRARVESEFTLEKMMARTEALYETLLAA